MTAKALVGSAALAGAVGYWTTVSSQSQLLGAFPNQATVHHPDRARVALTFDDGPNEPYTSMIADVLAARSVRATFFQVGRAVEQFPDTTRALLAQGHVIGNHTWSHRMRRCVTAVAIDDEIRRTRDVLAEHAGVSARLYRPPWLLRTPATFRVLERHRLTAVSGTFCHPFEVAQCSAQRIATRAVARATPGRFLIFHDGYNGQGADRKQTVDAVARTIDKLIEADWSFATVDELLGVDAYAEG